MGFSEQIIRYVSETTQKTTFASLFTHLKSNHPLDRKTLKRELARLVDSGDLRYTTRFGGSFIEVAYDRPRIVSDRVVLLPAGCSSTGFEGYCPVWLHAGASFGAGDHPTTRMAVQLIDRLLSVPSIVKGGRRYRALDIGTGSGLLAIVAAKLGVEKVEGIDIDPCSISEARKNVRINGVADAIGITNDELESCRTRYHFIMANLRTPTLLVIRKTVEKITRDDSALVFSGMKEEETEAICEQYRKSGFNLVDKRADLGWSAICLIRRPVPAVGVGS